MKKIKRWFIDRLLPKWAKETVLTELQHAYDLIDKQEKEIENLKAYIEGLKAGTRSQRKIVIYNGEVKK